MSSMSRHGCRCAWPVLIALLAVSPAWADDEPAREQAGTGKQADKPGDAANEDPGEDYGGAPEGSTGDDSDAEGLDSTQGDGFGARPKNRRSKAASHIALDETTAKPWSQSVPMDTRITARTLFYRGNNLADDQYLATAAAKYQEALGMWRHPAIHYNLALVHLLLQQPVEAYQNLEQAVQHGPEPLGQERYEEAQSQLEMLRAEVVRIEVVCDHPGAVVSLNGARLFVGPGRYRGVVTTGEYHLAARKPGLVADVRRVVLPAGQEVQYRLIMREWTRERRIATWKPWTVIGIGAAVGLAGGYSHWTSAGKFDSFDKTFSARCGAVQEPMEAGSMPRPVCPAAADDIEVQMLDGARSWRKAAATSYIAGGVILAAGAGLLYWNRERSYLRAAQAEGTSGPAKAGKSDVTVIPAIAPSGVAVHAEIRF